MANEQLIYVLGSELTNLPKNILANHQKQRASEEKENGNEKTDSKKLTIK